MKKAIEMIKRDRTKRLIQFQSATKYAGLFELETFRDELNRKIKLDKQKRGELGLSKHIERRTPKNMGQFYGIKWL